MFDSREYLASIRPPEFVALNGKRYVGRVLSADEFAPLQQAMRDARNPDGTADEARFYRAMCAIVAAMFPRPWWRFWERPVVAWFRRLPQRIQLKAFWGFIESQAQARGTEIQLSPGTRKFLGMDDAAPSGGPPTAG